jgi:nucleoside-diphosphate-sugar epimerase
MRILLTGNMGYVGPVVVQYLRRKYPNAYLVGFDSGLFAHCLTTHEYPESVLDQQRFADVRGITSADLVGFDAVVHLAGVSNDPIGHKFEPVTEEINYHASLRIARAASDARVRNFVFASSCSIYGAAKDDAPRTEASPLNPLTSYARSKISAEAALKRMDRQGMVVTCLRFATACGMSDRLRLDLVVNDFVASALASGEIKILSDGSPWRPLIDVHDMARAIDWAIAREPDSGGEYLAVNVGAERCNYQVRELAEAVARAIPSARITINQAAQPDSRSYRVDFGLYVALAPNHLPQVTLEQSIDGLRDGLINIGFIDVNFRNSRFVRLKVLESLVASQRLLKDLRWAALDLNSKSMVSLFPVEASWRARPHDEI